DLRVDDWRLPDTMTPIDFGLPRVIRSTFRHIYIKLIGERKQAL
ncbi:MAG: thylakoid-associated protein, partial [Arthrospira platensis]